ncbi:MAG: AraC family transcriptional regulator [Clostridia bacterium]|nr:AraC family transcriptional regulator [Clostridia bacterium]
MDTTMTEKNLLPFHPLDLGMYYCGQRVKTKNHSYGPEIRSHFLIVLVEQGHATMFSPKRIQLHAHDLFVMFPGERVHYKALTDWSIRWIGIYGEAVESLLSKCGITRKNPICRVDRFTELSELLYSLLKLSDDPYEASHFKRQSLLYDFLALLMHGANKNTVNAPVEAAKHIIKFNYNTDLTLTKLADRLNLNPTYFSRLFKEKTGMSPKQYILKIRMDRAKELLSHTQYTVKEISNSIGFPDSLYFSRLFKKYENLSPLAYRKNTKQ